MELNNEMMLTRAGAFGTEAWKEAESLYLRMLAPVCPHIAEELWERTGHDYSGAPAAWRRLMQKLPGKTKSPGRPGEWQCDRLIVPVSISEADAKTAALESDAVKVYLQGKPPKKVIYVPGKLVNIVV